MRHAILDCWERIQDVLVLLCSSITCTCSSNNLNGKVEQASTSAVFSAIRHQIISAFTPVLSELGNSPHDFPQFDQLHAVSQFDEYNRETMSQHLRHLFRSKLGENATERIP